MVFANASNSAIFLRFTSIFSSILPRTPAMRRFAASGSNTKNKGGGSCLRFCENNHNAGRACCRLCVACGMGAGRVLRPGRGTHDFHLRHNRHFLKTWRECNASRLDTSCKNVRQVGEAIRAHTIVFPCALSLILHVSTCSTRLNSYSAYSVVEKSRRICRGGVAELEAPPPWGVTSRVGCRTHLTFLQGRVGDRGAGRSPRPAE